MKKKLAYLYMSYVMITSIVCMATPARAFAADMIDNTSAIASTVSDPDVMPEKYRALTGAFNAAEEYKNSLDIKDDEYTELGEDYMGEFDEKQYLKDLSSQPATHLTQKQIDEGWALINGRAYPPNTLDGDMGEVLRGESDVDPDNAGYVTFIAKVDKGITDPVYIGITNTVTFETYAYEMSVTNDYTTIVPVPPGSYIISEGGLTTDYKAQFTVSESTFTVKEAESKIVKFRVVDRAAQWEKHKYDDTEKEVSDNTIEGDDIEEDKPETNNGFRIFWFISGVLMLVIFVVGGYFGIRYFKNNS